jgi:hypothetical protein
MYYVLEVEILVTHTGIIARKRSPPEPVMLGRWFYFLKLKNSDSKRNLLLSILIIYFLNQGFWQVVTYPPEDYIWTSRFKYSYDM